MGFQTLPVSIQTMTYQSPWGKIHYPRITGGTNTQALDTMNRAIVDLVNNLIKKQTPAQGEEISQMIGSFEIKTNERGVLSLSLLNYTFVHHSAHGMTYIKSLTFDIKNGRPYALKDLFKPGSDYVQVLSGIIQAQIKKRDIQLLNGFSKISPDQDFYIADKALVIYFQLYEITPYYIGFPMFPISVFELQDIVVEDGLLGRMATNQ